MRNRALLTATLAAGMVAVAAAQQASPSGAEASGAVVFVQTNEPTGNHIVVYDVGPSGRLHRANTYATGGNGGVASPGTEADHLASQGSLVYDSTNALLLAVNAGSDSVSTFRVSGDELQLDNVVPSGGQFPTSIAVRKRLVYVLNSGGTGTVQGFRVRDDGLRPIPDSGRSLGLANSNPPDFLDSPGEVGFTPSGGQLLVTTKNSGSLIDVFRVGPNGLLSSSPVANPAATPVPFSFTFTPTGRLASAEAGNSVLSTYVVQTDGTLADPHSLTDSQSALCWIQRVGQYYYVSNTGNATVSAFTVSADGQPSLVGANGIAAGTEAGPIDQTAPSGTSFVYVETGGGTVDEFKAESDGSLTKLGVVDKLPSGIQGIAST